MGLPSALIVCSFVAINNLFGLLVIPLTKTFTFFIMSHYDLKNVEVKTYLYPN